MPKLWTKVLDKFWPDEKLRDQQSDSNSYYTKFSYSSPMMVKTFHLEPQQSTSWWCDRSGDCPSCKCWDTVYQSGPKWWTDHQTNTAIHRAMPLVCFKSQQWKQLFPETLPLLLWIMHRKCEQPSQEEILQLKVVPMKTKLYIVEFVDQDHCKYQWGHKTGLQGVIFGNLWALKTWEEVYI